MFDNCYVLNDGPRRFLIVSERKSDMKKVLPQEGLKLIACITMLVDHIGVVFFPQTLWLRMIGRLAFPIYAFLLVEGAAHTHHKLKYALRLFVGIVLAEPIFDMLFSGGADWCSQSVMPTLFLGYLMILAMERWSKAKIPSLVVAAALAEFLCTDYGMWGILMIAMFYLTRQLERKHWIQLIALLALSFFMGRSIQMFAVAAIIPICLYTGDKKIPCKAVQWIFYLFYPAHLMLLYLIAEAIYYFCG